MAGGNASTEGLCCGQTTIRSFLSPAKPRSPLVDHSLLPDAKCSSKHSAQKEPDRKGEGRLDVLPEGEEAGSPGRARGTEEVLAVPLPRGSESRPDRTGTPQGKGPGRRGRRRRNKPQKPAENDNSQNRKVTDYFPIRRSSRKSRAELKSEEHRQIEDLIQKGVEDGLEVRHIEGKGRGVFADGSFRKGQFVVEYHGDLLEIRDAKRREEEYGKDPATGCYMYYFQYHNKTYCVDATKETERVGRLINHSKNGNCQTKLHGIDGRPHLILVASRDIEKGEELLYDYGDRSKESIAAHPWLKH
ncbi:lysine methyltransferase 5Ab isoform X2 [Conger conger]|uniref:lysine methyltransferase 5Ab isoform X2 n=1 Tax=Conger conger TaxID=82655 RepID=UPI002A5AE624|nr:lysine methyltransferase 5Ab isoform X2 [Conger conger]